VTPHTTRPAAREPALDDLDTQLVRLLQRNGRTSNTELGRELGVTEATVRKRITRLTEAGLVRVVAVPSPGASGLVIPAIISIRTRPGTADGVAGQLSAFPEVRWVGLAVGRYDVLIQAVFTDNEHLLRFVSVELGRLDGIRSIETSMVLRVVKFAHEWELP